MLGTLLNTVGGLLQRFGLANAHRQQHAGDFVLHGIDQLAEQFKRLTLVFLLGLFLCKTTQVDALAQVVQRRQVIAPVRVKALQQDSTLKVHELLGAGLFQFAGIQGLRGLQALLQDVFVGDVFVVRDLGAQVQRHLPVGQRLFQGRDVPLLFHGVGRHILAHQLLRAARHHGLHHLRQVNGI